jgi:cytochrome c oxidase cbb3-type subunit I/II
MHFKNPQTISPGSIMPAYPWLAERKVDPSHIEGKIITLRRLGVPYPEGFEKQAADDMKSQAQGIAKRLADGGAQVEPSSEMVALIAYMQRLGTDIKHAPKEEIEGAKAPSTSQNK